MKPVYKITASNNDITALVRERFVSVSVKDSSGVDSDAMTLSLSDYDGKIVWPRKGVELKVWLGYDDTLHYKGSFIVDELDYAYNPDTLTILARASDVVKLRSGRESVRWGTVSLAYLIDALSAKHGLIPAISDELKRQEITDCYQLDESDMGFLTRLSTRFNAIAKVKNGRLIFIKKGAAHSAGGDPLPLVKIALSDTNGAPSYSERRSDEFDGVWVRYRELYTYTYPYSYRYYAGRTYSYYRYQSYQLGRGENIRRINQLFATREEAVAAAEALYDSLAAGASTLKMTLSLGKPDLIAESGLELSGFIGRINKLSWVISEVTHTLDGSGLSTGVSADRPAQG